MPQNGAPTAVYDWEAAYREDPRLKALQTALDRILATSFPAMAARLQKAEPPRQRQEASTIKHEQAANTREELDASAYLTESSSEVDSQVEVDPREALREMEERVARGQAPVASRKKSNDGDVDMDAVEEEENEEEEEQTACVVCHKSDNERQILICDGCENEYHLYCLRPPLAAVPPGDWFCPACVAKRPESAPTANGTESMDVDDVPLSEELVRIKQERAQGLFRTAPTEGDQAANNAATTVGIAQTFENDLERSNELLVHACNCDDLRCLDAKYRDFCPHMKRFLRSACWASHNQKWLSYRIAQATAELFAYHSLGCQLESCNVPMCEDLRVEEIV